jgi:hypothetical protein
MSETKKENVKDVSNSKNVNTMWDIDDATNFEEAFDIAESTSADPIIDFGTETKEKVITKEKEKTDTKLGSLEEDNDPVKEPELNLPEEKKEVSEEISDFDPGQVEGGSTPDSDNIDNDPVAIFANMLQEKEIIDLGEYFEPSEDGLINAVESTIDSRVKEELDLFQNTLTGEGRALLKHLINGGDVGNFVDTYSQVGFDKVDLKNANNQKYVLGEFMKLRGDSQQEIKENIELYEDNGILAKKAELAKNKLVNYQDTQKQEFAQRQVYEAQEKEKVRTEVVSNIQETIANSEEIKGVPLSRKAKKDLLSYMTVPAVKINDPGGGVQYVTQFQADEMKSSNDIDEFILKAYLRMTDYDMSSANKKSVTAFSSKLRNSLQNKKVMTDTKAMFGGNKKTTSSKSSNSWDL